MKIANYNYFEPITIEEENPETLIIENSVYFRKLIEDLLIQSSTDIGAFVTSEKDEPLSFSKYVQVITDIYNFSENERTLKTKIQKLITNEFAYSDKQYNLIESLNQFGILAANTVPYPVSFQTSLTLSDIVKILDFDIDYQYEKFWDKLIEFMKLEKELLNYKLFITINLKESISKEEYDQFIKDIQYRNIKLLMIEKHTHPDLDDLNHIRIVDNDLCVL